MEEILAERERGKTFWQMTSKFMMTLYYYLVGVCLHVLLNDCILERREGAKTKPRKLTEEEHFLIFYSFCK